LAASRNRPSSVASGAPRGYGDRRNLTTYQKGADMGITSTSTSGIAEVVMDNPPVNALERRRLVRARPIVRGSVSDP
jgi:hypothetical protein